VLVRHALEDRIELRLVERPAFMLVKIWMPFAPSFSIARSISRSASGTLFIGSEATKGKLARVRGDDLRHAVVRQARELRRLVVRREELDRGSDKVRICLYPESAASCAGALPGPTARDVESTLDLRGKRGILLSVAFIRSKTLRKDVREDVELEIRVMSA